MSANTEPVLVVGLGRFGRTVALTLAERGHEVMAIDNNQDLVDEYAGQLTSVVRADSTHEEAMRQVGAALFGRAVVGIGNAIEASVLTVGVLVDLGVAEIWAKAISRAHARILERVGAARVVLPEHEMGRRLAQQLSERMLNYAEFGHGLVMMECTAPKDLWDRSLDESQLSTRHQVVLVATRSEAGGFAAASPATRVRRGDVIIVAGAQPEVEAFARLP